MAQTIDLMSPRKETIMVIPKETKAVPFDKKEILDTLYGIKEEDYSAFMRDRDLRRHTTNEKLKTKPTEEEAYLTFANLRTIDF